MQEGKEICCSESSRPIFGKDEFTIDQEISHLTKLRSELNEKTRKGMPNGRKPCVSNFKLISGREFNYSGRGKFSSADCSYIFRRYLPVNDPRCVDDMDSKAYVSQFSADGSLLVAGFQGSHIKIYNVNNDWKMQKNIIAKSLQWTITDTSLSPDQRFLIWDKRCLTNRKPAGILSGHIEGITFIDSRRDGIYFISNGKDQSIKLWDIRRMCAKAKHIRPRVSSVWDYRWMAYPRKDRYLRHPNDQSLATYKGHSVLRTLIHCYFSPAHSTGQRYIYTGSNDKHVYIYDVVSGALVARLAFHRSTIRDCSWHPYYPLLVSSSWDCRIARWEYSGKDEIPCFGKKKRRRQQAD